MNRNAAAAAAAATVKHGAVQYVCANLLLLLLLLVCYLGAQDCQRRKAQEVHDAEQRSIRTERC
jgi:hypothetical protein